MAEFWPAPEVREIAEDLIPRHHDHLQNVRIEYVFRDKCAKDKGRDVWGKARKVSGLNAFLSRKARADLLRDGVGTVTKDDTKVTISHGDNSVDTTVTEMKRVAETLSASAQANPHDYFVIEIAQEAWRFLSDTQKIALVDHELCHLTTDYNDAGERVLAIAPHDVEEFAEVVKRHGLWSGDVKAFINQATQLSLIDTSKVAEG